MTGIYVVLHVSMLSYFAFGSNMSQRRLESRIGTVATVGCGVLLGYEHRFDKFGADGTAKGNIVVAPRHQVHGVVYRITLEQLDELAEYEGGYRRESVEVSHANATIEASTFVALRPGCDVGPSPEYLQHYAEGMLEHGIDRRYAERLVAGLDADLVRAFDRAWELLASRR